MLARLSAVIKKQLYLRSKTILVISIIAALGIISITWFKGSFLINGLDRSFPPDRTAYFIRGFYAWDIFQLGAVSIRTLAGLFPANIFLYVTEVAGLSLVSAEKLWFYLLFVSAGFSMYFLSTTVYCGKYYRLVGLVSALFFMFNPYTIISIVPQMWLYIIFLPLILGLFIKGLQEKRGIKYIFGFSLIWTFTITSDYTNPKFLLFDLIPLFLYFICYMLFYRSKVVVKRVLRFTGLLSAVWFGLNAFWLVPTISSLGNIIASPQTAYAAIGTSRLSNYALASAPLSGSFRLLGFWSLDANYLGIPYAYWAQTYNTALFIAIGFLIPMIAFAFLIRRPTNLKRFFFVILAIIGLSIMNGVLQPSGWINTFLTYHVPMWVDVFSSPYMFGGIYVSIAFAFLVGSFIPDLLESKLIKKAFSFRKGQLLKYLLTGLIVFLIVGLYAFPLWDGEVIYPGNDLMASNRYKIPSYYNDAKVWLQTDSSDFRLFSLPYSIIGYGAYNWLPAGFNGPDPTELLLGRSLLAGLTGQGLGLEVARGLVNGSGYGVAKALALMNVKYVVVHNDAAWSYVNGSNWYVSPTPDQIKSSLNNQTGFTFKKSFGQLDLYLNKFWEPMRVYTVSSSILLDGSQSQILEASQRPDFNLSESVLALSSQLDGDQVTTLPIGTVFIQTPDLNMSYNPVFAVQDGQRLVYLLKSKVVAEARYYSGWKGVVSTNGQGDPGMIVFSSPSSCPYLNAFPQNFTNWNSYNSTLIYITTNSSPLTINSITADGVSVPATAWWQSGASWITGWPITIPSNQNAIIQVNQQASSITLQTNNGPITLSITDGWKNPLTTESPSEIPTTIVTPTAGAYLLAIKVATGYGYGNLLTKIDNHTFNIDVNSQEQGPVFTYKSIGPINLTAGHHTISTSGEKATIPVYDGPTNPINWTSTFTNQSYTARYYPDWKAVIRTDGSEPSDTMSFPTLDQCPYTFPLNFTCWNAYNSTLVYLVTGDNPLRIDEIMTHGNTTSDINGVWWQTGYIGMATKPVTYPIIIPPNQIAIIQINHKTDNVTLETNPPQIDNMLLYSLKNGESFVDADNLLSANHTNNTSITYEEINPTQYTVHVNSSSPFYLVFSDSYDHGWIATINGQQISDQYHFTANGYANGWYINKTGAYNITLEFKPQNLFYAGAAISITTLIICIVYVSKNKLKYIYKKYFKKKIVSN
jgi:hypothetical protein